VDLATNHLEKAGLAAKLVLKEVRTLHKNLPLTVDTAAGRPQTSF
jgi:hypothetical protein